MPDIESTVLGGAIRSDIPLGDQNAYGEDLIMWRSHNVESSQRLVLTVSFDDLYIHVEGVSPKTDVAPEPGGELVRATDEGTAVASEGMEVVVDAPLGDIHVEGVDDERLLVKANKLARLRSTANAQAVLSALALSVKALDTRVLVQTRVEGDMAALGATYHRVDLDLQCPRDVVLKVTGSNGRTVIAGMGGPVEVMQTEGFIQVEHVKGAVDLTNHQGGVQVHECGGPLNVSVKGGAVTTRNIRGAQSVSCVDGEIVIDTPFGPVSAIGQGGNARIIPLEGIAGNYDVRVERGNVSLLVPETADAVLYATAANGMVRSAKIPLTGSIEPHPGTEQRTVSKYQARLRDGLHTVKVETQDGDVSID
jgi:hypothetical protein